jgi:hypothetical protein
MRFRTVVGWVQRWSIRNPADEIPSVQRRGQLRSRVNGNRARNREWGGEQSREAMHKDNERQAVSRTPCSPEVGVPNPRAASGNNRGSRHSLARQDGAVQGRPTVA